MKQKYISCLLFVLMMATSLFLVTGSGLTDGQLVRGDVNGDNAINMKDVLLLRKYLAGIIKEIDENLADCNRDGNVNMKDVLLLRKYLAGIAELPEIYEDIETDVTDA